MDTLLFSQHDKETIWSVLAAVLHLGNIQFTDKRNPDVDEVAKVANKDVLAFAAQLVGCDAKVYTHVDGTVFFFFVHARRSSCFAPPPPPCPCLPSVVVLIGIVFDHADDVLRGSCPSEAVLSLKLLAC